MFLFRDLDTLSDGRDPSEQENKYNSRYLHRPDSFGACEPLKTEQTKANKERWCDAVETASGVLFLQWQCEQIRTNGGGIRLQRAWLGRLRK
jgi:hypothetical protein